MATIESHHLRPLRASRAVHPIPKSSKGHFVGELVFNRGNVRQRMGYGSMLEHDAGLCMIYRPGFADLEEQLAAVVFTGVDGARHEHFFDFRLTQTSGRKICISVKPEQIAETEVYKAQIAAVKRAAIGSICHAVATITERNIAPDVLHNAKLYHAARDPEPELDAEIHSKLHLIVGPTPIGDFLGQIGVGGAGFFSMARAIRFGHVHLFAPGKIRSETLVTAVAA